MLYINTTRMIACLSFLSKRIRLPRPPAPDPETKIHRNNGGHYGGDVLTRRKVRGNYKTFHIRIQQLLACFFGGEKTSNAGPATKRMAKARRSACLSFLSKRSCGQAAGQWKCQAIKNPPTFLRAGFGGRANLSHK